MPSPHLRILVVALVVILLPVVAVSTAPAGQALSRSAFTARTHDATNDARAARNIRPLRTNACLQRAARRQAERMARSGRMTHSDNARAVMRRCRLSSWGENVAQAMGSDRGRGVVRQWMASSGHRANILNRGFGMIGIGAVKARGSWWVVQVFGRRM